MNKTIRFLFSSAIFSILFACSAPAQPSKAWTRDQLMPPAQLAEKIKSGKDLPVIISVGPGALIPGSVDIGNTGNAANLQKFRKTLDNLSKDSELVIYCGCCPFEHCPNVKPAMETLKSLKFTNYHLLNLEHNIKTDWIDKGFPVTQ